MTRVKGIFFLTVSPHQRDVAEIPPAFSVHCEKNKNKKTIFITCQVSTIVLNGKQHTCIFLLLITIALKLTS